MGRLNRWTGTGVITLVICVLIGMFLGVSGYTFVYAGGASYLGENPATCVQCHIMRPEYDGWQKASHHAAATCNDCHLPHDNLFNKLFVKASNGYHHSVGFTFQNFHEPIRIKPSNAAVLEANCLRCHGELTSAITQHGTLGASPDPSIGPDLYGCVRCHQGVGHGPTR